MYLVRRIVDFVAGYLPAAEETSTPASSAPAFKYDALEPDHIRVLTLLPAEQDSDPFRCTLRPMSRADAASCYSALSYTWGDEPRVMKTVTVVESGTNGEEHDRLLSTRPNLHEALMTLRRTMPAHAIQPSLWIDALCINQDDVSEKTEQIRQMDQTYASASNVIIWLGPSEQDCDYVMDSISNKVFSEYATQRFILGLLALLGRPWFSRTWIVQELVLNKTAPLISCGGGRLITWDDLDDAYAKAIPIQHDSAVPQELSTKQWEALSALLPEVRKRTVSYLMLRSMRTGMQSTAQSSGQLSPYHLRYAIRATRWFQATDPRDKIYGILALTVKEARQDLEVDYHKVCEDVFRDAAYHILHRERAAAMYALSPLRRSGLHQGSSQAMAALPSWVPDFSAPHEFSDEAPGRLLDESRIPLHRAEDVKLSPCGKKLLTKALFLDIIQTTHTTPPHGLQPVPIWAYPQVFIVLLLAWIRNLVASGTDRFWASPSQAMTYCAQLVNMVDTSKSLVEIERLAGSRALRWGSTGAAEPLWKTLFFAVQAGEEKELYEGHTASELQAKFDLLMHIMNSTAEREGRRPWYSRYMPSGRIGLLFSQILPRTDPVSKRIFAALQLSRTFFAGRGIWYGFVGGEDVREDDKLVLLFPGADVPFVLREKKNEAGEYSYTMVGVARLPEQLRKAAVRDGEGSWIDIVIE